MFELREERNDYPDDNLDFPASGSSYIHLEVWRRGVASRTNLMFYKLTRE